MFVGTDFLTVPFAVAIPIFLMFLFILANGAMQSPCIFSATCLGMTIAWGIATTCSGASVFIVGVGAGVEGMGQTSLALNKFSEADPVLGQGVASLTGPWVCLQVVGHWSCKWKDFPGVFLLGKELH